MGKLTHVADNFRAVARCACNIFPLHGAVIPVSRTPQCFVTREVHRRQAMILGDRRSGATATGSTNIRESGRGVARRTISHGG
jgi:hypothetical protein